MNNYILVILSAFFILLIIIGVASLLLNIFNDFAKQVLKYDVSKIELFLYTVLGYLLLMNTILPISLIVTL